MKDPQANLAADDTLRSKISSEFEKVLMDTTFRLRVDELIPTQVERKVDQEGLRVLNLCFRKSGENTLLVNDDIGESHFDALYRVRDRKRDRIKRRLRQRGLQSLLRLGDRHPSR